MVLQNNTYELYRAFSIQIVIHGGLVYVIAWVAVVFGINCASNVGRKLVIVRGEAEHYYCFLPTLREQLIPNTMANHAITN